MAVENQFNFRIISLVDLNPALLEENCSMNSAQFVPSYFNRFLVMFAGASLPWNLLHRMVAITILMNHSQIKINEL